MKKVYWALLAALVLCFAPMAAYAGEPLPDHLVFWFPDDAFRNAILDAAGIDLGDQEPTAVNLEGDVLTKIEGIKNLDVSGLGLTGLQGLNRLSGLETLDCSNNKITSLIIFDTLTNLKTILCNANEITTFTVGVPNFETLDISGNPLTALSGLPGPDPDNGLPNRGLRVLNCSNTKLETLPVLPPTLVSLDCSNNPGMTIGEYGLPGTLKEFNCANNEMTALPVLSPVLETLDCSGNKLTAFPGAKAEDGVPYGMVPMTLKTLNLSDNLFEELPLLAWTAGTDKADALVTLDASNLPALTKFVAHAPNLTTINLTGATALTTIDVSGSAKLTALNVTGATLLETINAQDTMITSVSQIVGIADAPGVEVTVSPSNSDDGDEAPAAPPASNPGTSKPITEPQADQPVPGNADATINKPVGTVTDSDGIHLPPTEGATMTTPEATIVLPASTTIAPDGTITVPSTEGVTATVTNTAGTQMTLPAGTKIAASDGTITLPANTGATAKTGAATIALPADTTMKTDGTITTPATGTGATVTANGATMTLPPSTTIDTTGTINLPSETTVTTASYAEMTVPADTKITSSGAFDGTARVKASGSTNEVTVSGALNAWTDSNGGIALGASTITLADGTVITLTSGSIYESPTAAANRTAGGEYLLVDVKEGGGKVTYTDGTTAALESGDKVQLNPDGKSEIVKAPTTPPAGEEEPGTSSGSGGGCAAASFSLLALALLPLARKRAR